MAGNEDRNRIGPVGGGYCAHGFGASQFSRQFAVGNGFAVRDILQFSPHRVLEIRSGKYQGNVECGSFPGEIFVELGDRSIDRIRSAVFVNGVQGMSMAPILRGDGGAGREYALTEFTCYDWGLNLKTLTGRDYKLTYYAGEQFGELYDRNRDPHEFVNLWDNPEYRPVREELLRRLLDRVIQTEDTLPLRIGKY